MEDRISLATLSLFGALFSAVYSFTSFVSVVCSQRQCEQLSEAGLLIIIGDASLRKERFRSGLLYSASFFAYVGIAIETAFWPLKRLFDWMRA